MDHAETHRRAVSLLSGGLDSATSTAQAIADGYEVTALTINYGQRHSRELSAARTLVNHFGIRDHITMHVDLSAWGGSSLTSSLIPLPVGCEEREEIPSTYVPGRNTVFISLALSLAEARQCTRIYLGVNAIDYSGYPDCRPEYIDAFQKLASLATVVGVTGGATPLLVAPLMHDSKVSIVRRALGLGVPIEQTWSCYEGGEAPCGVCDSCRIRDAALEMVGRPDLGSRGGHG